MMTSRSQTYPKNVDFALAYASLGWSVLPVWSVDDDGQCRCPRRQNCPTPGKHPQSDLVPHGHQDASLNEQVLRDWWARDPGAGVGLALSTSGLLALDIDPRNGGLDSLADFEAAHGALLTRCVASTQGGGEHRVFLADSNISFPGTLGTGLDLKHRGYICVEPTKGPLGEYRWKTGASPLDGHSPSKLPKAILASAKQPGADEIRHLRPGTVVAPDSVFEDLAAALQVIPADLPYDDWLKVLFGMSRLQPTNQARTMTREWSVSSTKEGHTEEAFDAKWESVASENSNVNYRTVFFLADQFDRSWRDHSLRNSKDSWPEINLRHLQLEAIDYLIDDFLARSLMVLVGKPGMGKSTAAIALGAVIAGITLPGCPLRAPAKGRKVIYLTEDADQFKRNFIALAINCGIDRQELEDAFVLLPARRVPASDLVELKHHVERHTTYSAEGVKLRPWLVLDTTAASIHLKDENDNAEVSNAIALLKSEFYESLQCSVCLIAHSRKHSGQSDLVSDARGAGAWSGDATLTAGLYDSGGIRQLVLVKRRYNPKHTALQIQLLSSTVTLHDRYGRPQAQMLETALFQWCDSSIVNNFSSTATQKRDALCAKVLRFIHSESLSGRIFSQNALYARREQIEADLGKERLKATLERLLALKFLEKGSGTVGTNNGWEYRLTESGIESLNDNPT